MADLCHYETSQGNVFSVACGANPLSVKVLTGDIPLVTCPLCINSPAYRLTVLEQHTDVRPSDRAKLRRIRNLLGDYDRGVHSEEETLAIIKDIINMEGPSHGKD